MEDIKVTIIVPVYNTEIYLKECIESILEQSHKNIELICVDDCSEDASYEILQHYGKKDRRMKVLRSEDGNQGPGAIRNQGIKMAKGTYIAFVDSDDYIDPNMIAKLLYEAETYDLDLSMCTIKKFSANAREKFPKCVYDYYIHKDLDGKTFHWKDIEQVLFRLRFSSCNKLYRKDFLIQNNIYFAEGVFWEDMVFTYKALLLAKKMRFIRENLYFNRKARSGSTTGTQGGRAVTAFDSMAILEEFLTRELQEKSLVDQFKAFQFRKLYSYLYLNDQEHMEAFYYKLKEVVQHTSYDENEHISMKQRQMIQQIRELDAFGFLINEYYRLRTYSISLKRRLKKQGKKYKSTYDYRLKKKFGKIQNYYTKMLQILKEGSIHLLGSILSKITPKNPNKVVVQAPYNGSFSDNGKYTYLWLEEDRDIKPVYLTYEKKAATELNKEGINAAAFPSWKAFQALLQSPMILEAATALPYSNWIRNFTAKSLRVQLWHGAGVKKVHLGSAKRTGKKRGRSTRLIEALRKDHPMYDLIYFSSRVLQEERKDSFQYRKARINGFTRNDCLLGKHFEKELINTDLEMVKAVRGLKDQNKKIILYAPTYRARGVQAFGKQIPINFRELNHLMEERDTYLVVKLHPWMDEEIPTGSYDRILEYDKNRDIYPLMASFDVMITDYSSIFSDFALLEKPIIHYFPDYQKALERLRVSPEMIDRMTDHIHTGWEDFLEALSGFLKDETEYKPINIEDFHSKQEGFNGETLLQDLKKKLQSRHQ